MGVSDDFAVVADGRERFGAGRVGSVAWMNDEKKRGTGVFGAEIVENLLDLLQYTCKCCTKLRPSQRFGCGSNIMRNDDCIVDSVTLSGP